MPGVLGIDAAWTAKEPSGVAADPPVLRIGQGDLGIGGLAQIP